MCMKRHPQDAIVPPLPAYLHVVVLQGVENSICVLRNLSYQVYSEMQPSTLRRLEGPSRSEDRNTNPVIGCFTPQSRKAKNVRCFFFFF